ncbi:P-loop NTPase fold protein [Paenibacillus taichungensis]|uniref:P-loop NTPase fold protein n=1 Tax=Paenibacillus taichungensis TaxID=484184 RepID=UPI0038176C98
MHEANEQSTLIKVSYLLMLKWFLFGAICVEIGYCMINFLYVLNNIAAQRKIELFFWIIVALYILFSMLFFKKIFKTLATILKSKRIDLLIVTISGSFSMYLIGGMGVKLFKSWLNTIPWLYLFLIASIPIVFYVSKATRIVQVRKLLSRNKNDSLFLSDREGKTKTDDVFEYYETAERFAERVFNQGSPESLVYGIDAPWGTGKSTFVNLCKSVWEDKYKKEIIVYTFDPVKHENNENLMEKFVNGLTKVIKNNFFVPELETLLAKYVQLLNDSKVTFSMFGVRFGLPFGNASIDKILERLEVVLTNIDKKIIIVIDDIDRLNFSNIKEILFVVKKSFSLPNISYVICYDTESIATLEQQKLDSEKIIEFLEKFVNIKISLYLDHKLLLRYFTESKDDKIDRNLLSNPLLVSKAVEGLTDIFNSTDFHLYIPFIGDARKLKRLVNIIIMLEIDQVDFTNLDLNKHDLIHLLMIYMNYPNIFRKIYNTETQGKRGFFSLVTKNEEGFTPNKDKEVEYSNSIKYQEYLKSLNHNQQFILNQVFDANKRLDSSKNIPEQNITSFACFNGSRYRNGHRNLEQYLNLIIKFSRPIPTDQYKFYSNLKNEILNGSKISEIFNREEFSFTYGEKRHVELWRVITNTNNNNISLEKSKEIIRYLLESIPNYSIVTMEKPEIGLRNGSIHYILVKLLDKFGWTDELKMHHNNTDSNVRGIAEWIFGEKQFKNEGILNRLASEERGILGLYDLLNFRLSCCTDRGGDIYNLSRSLSKHGGSNNPTSGPVKNITIGEMREISQYTFNIFKIQYIDKNINIFEEIFGLPADALYSRSIMYIKSEVSNEFLIKELERSKSKIILFMLYQLGGSSTANGVPCGYYDINGNDDNHEINIAVNSYLFDFCFNPQKSDKGYEYFLYYLYFKYRMVYGDTSMSILNVKEITDVLNIDRVTEYWRDFKEDIKSKTITCGNDLIMIDSNKTSFTEFLKSIYKYLDELLIKD